MKMLSNTEALRAKPWMKTILGFDESPMASAYTFVPSAEEIYRASILNAFERFPRILQELMLLYVSTIHREAFYGGPSPARLVEQGSVWLLFHLLADSRSLRRVRVSPCQVPCIHRTREFSGVHNTCILLPINGHVDR